MQALGQVLTQSTDIVSALSTEVPVLGCYYSPRYTARVATNFLRSGCPGVQIILEKTVDEETIEWSWKDELKELKHYFRALRLKGEQFTFSCSKDPPFVFFVTRSSTRKKLGYS
ncbi:MAG: hypothetical protein Q8R32_01330 [bacterium]|nr:hypothetical protein [bacterium]